MEKNYYVQVWCVQIFASLQKEIEDLEEGGIDIFHLDVMDGSFVPNFGMGLQDIEYICKTAIKPCDVHLMIENPSKYVEKFASLGAKIIYIHPEIDPHACRTLQMIKDAGAKAGIAINPGTSFETVKDLLHLCDYVMLMSVNPGFAGQKYLDFVTPKIQKVLSMKQRIMVDMMSWLMGHVLQKKIEMLSKIGVKGFILGTSALFGKDKSYQEIIKELREL